MKTILVSTTGMIFFVQIFKVLLGHMGIYLGCCDIDMTQHHLPHAQIRSAFPREEKRTYEAKGRDLVAGIPKTLTISDEEVREAILEPVTTIVDAIRIALERTPPELAADIVDRGIVLAGGGSLLKGLDVLIREETELPIAIAEDPLTCVVRGTGKVLDELDLLKQIQIA